MNPIDQSTIDDLLALADALAAMALDGRYPLENIRAAAQAYWSKRSAMNATLSAYNMKGAS